MWPRADDIRFPDDIFSWFVSVREDDILPYKDGKRFSKPPFTKKEHPSLDAPVMLILLKTENPFDWIFRVVRASPIRRLLPQARRLENRRYDLLQYLPAFGLLHLR